MGIPGYDGLVLTLDPVAEAPDRTELDLNTGIFNVLSLDWGDAAIVAAASQQGRFGNSVADFSLPNRTVTIVLDIGDDGVSFSKDDAEAALRDLSMKVGLFQREGGILLRQRSGGDPLYADVVNASLTPVDEWMETLGHETGISLVLECLPDFYGDEITLDAIDCTAFCDSVLQLDSADAVIEGDYPARCQIEVTDSSGNVQSTLFWGIRSRLYDPASTAMLSLEAQDLTMLSGATTATLAGSIASHVVKIEAPVAGLWVPMLATNFGDSGGEAQTHVGTYRMIVRAYSATEQPQLRLVWGGADLAVPNTNEAVTLNTVGGFNLVDLGIVRLDRVRVGAQNWIGVIQTQAVAVDDDVQIDMVWLVPLDEAAGLLAAGPAATPADLLSSPGAGTQTSANMTGIGTVAWLGTGDTGGHASVVDPGAVSEYLKETGFGFDIPSGATIEGINVTVAGRAATGGIVIDNAVKLLKAGSVVGSDRSQGQWPDLDNGLPMPTVYGSSSDLWGTTWTPAQINASNFGSVISVEGVTGGIAIVSSVAITVFFSFTTGLSLAADAVVYASQTCVLGTDGMVRTADGTTYGPVASIMGDLPRLPPSGTENRLVELFVKPSRSDLKLVTDSGVDTFTVTPKYRPSYLTRI